MTGKSNHPKIISREKKGSVEQTYEFEYLNQPAERTLGQIIYDSGNGKILGRTPKNWGERSSTECYHQFPYSSTRRRLMMIIVCAPNQHQTPRKCLPKLFLSTSRVISIVVNFKGA